MNAPDVSKVLEASSTHRNELTTSDRMRQALPIPEGVTTRSAWFRNRTNGLLENGTVDFAIEMVDFGNRTISLADLKAENTQQ